MFLKLDKDIDNFKNSSFLGKLGYSSLIIGKGVLNVAMGLTVGLAKDILKNPNASDEQKEKAREYLKKYNK